MKRVAALLVFGSLSAVAGEASADELELGDRKQLHQWVSCIAQKDRRLARDMALDKPKAMERAFNGGFFFKPECVPGGKNVRFLGLSFFGPIAEYVLRSEAPPKAKRAPEKVALEMESAAAEALKKQEISLPSQQSQLIYLNYVGICLHRRNPDASSQLLQTKIDSADEKGAFQALATAIQECRFPGYTYNASYDELRGAIAAMRLRLVHLAARKADDA